MSYIIACDDVSPILGYYAKLVLLVSFTIINILSDIIPSDWNYILVVSTVAGAMIVSPRDHAGCRKTTAALINTRPFRHAFKRESSTTILWSRLT